MTTGALSTTGLPEGSRVLRNLAWIAAAGFLATIAGIVLSPARTWASILLAGTYVAGMSLGAGMLIALQYVSNAGWGVAIRRVPEAMAAAFPLGAAMLVATLAGMHSLYEWSHAEAVAADPLLQAKSVWLNPSFFAARTIGYVLLWWWLLRRILSASRRQDAAGDPSLTAAAKWASVVYIVAFALTFTLASMDWIMSLEPHWYSTIFAIYNFCGAFLSGLAGTAVIAIVLRRTGPFREVLSEGHLLNLGKLIFAFSTFWMYIWFSQYLLIWYANIPEEAVYYLRREEGSWVIFTVVNVAFNWFIPFVVLLPRWTKKHEGVLLRICVLLLLGRWIDLFWMILPPFMPAAPVVTVWELAPLAVAIPLFFILVFHILSRHRIIPVADPMLVESLPRH